MCCTMIFFVKLANVRSFDCSELSSLVLSTVTSHILSVSPYFSLLVSHNHINRGNPYEDTLNLGLEEHLYVVCHHFCVLLSYC